MVGLETFGDLLRLLWNRREVESEIDCELRHHLDLMVEENLAAGMSPDEARRAAEACFGNFKSVSDVCREVQTAGPASWLADLADACRLSLKKPLFTALVVMTLAVAIGANVAIFSIVDSLLWQPLPFAPAERLATIQETDSHGGEIDVSSPDFLDLRTQTKSFAALASYTTGTATVLGGKEPELTPIAYVSGDFFSVMGEEMFSGHPLSPNKHQASTEAVVVSDRAWRRLFPGQTLGDQRLVVAGQGYSLVGVARPEFNFPPGVDLWIPNEPFEDGTSRSAHNLKLVARLKNDVSLSQAQTEIEELGRYLNTRYPESHVGLSLVATSLRESLVARIRPALSFFLIAVGIALLVSCVTVSNLLLVRDLERRTAIVRQLRLGASRVRVFRRVLIECLFLSAVGGIFGFLLSGPLATVISSAFVTGDVLNGVRIGTNSFVFTITLSLLTGLLSGLMPASRLSLLNETEPDEPPATGTDKGSLRLTGLMVVAEVALTAILLIGAGVLVKNLWQLHRIDPGFDPGNVLTAKLSLPSSEYNDTARTVEFFRRTLRQINGAPGVDHAGAINNLPLTESAINGTFFIDDHPEKSGNAVFSIVSPDYFQTLSIPLFRGRVFQEQDDEHSTQVAIISQSLAERFFPDEDPIGKRIRFAGMDEKDLASEAWMTVAGVVADVKHIRLDAYAWPEVYVPYMQRPLRAKDMTVVVKTSSHSPADVSMFRPEVHAVDQNVPVEFGTMNEVLSGAMAHRRSRALLMTTLSLAALLLLAPGFYSVMAFSISKRLRTQSSDWREMIRFSIRRGILLAGTGVLLGSVASIALSNTIGAALVGRPLADPLSIGIAALILLTLAFIISYFPAREAAKHARLSTIGS